MKRADVKVRGTRILLFHRFNIDVISDAKKPKTGKAGDNPEEWKETIYHKNGQLYLPDIYWFMSMREGAKYSKKKLGSIQKEFISCSIMLSKESFLDRYMPEGWEKKLPKDMPREETDPVFLHICGVNNPNTKGRNIRYRIACAPGWRTNFSMCFDDRIVSPSQVEKVIHDAGQLVGVGDARLMGNGRFTVEDIEFSDYKE